MTHTLILTRSSDGEAVELPVDTYEDYLIEVAVAETMGTLDRVLTREDFPEAQPEAAQPEAAQPEAAQPEAAQPEALRIKMYDKPFLVTNGHTTAIATPDFIKVHGLDRSHMSKLNRGLIKQHKGWTKVDLTDYNVILTLEHAPKTTLFPSETYW